MQRNISDHFLTARGRPADYTAPGGSAVSCRAIIRDIDKEMRATRSTDLVASDAVATVSASLNPRRGGLLACNGNEYEISGTVRAGVPGLIELGLVRISGAGVESHDFSAAVLDAMGEPIVIDGKEYRGQINRSGLLVEEDKWGAAVEVVRHVVAIRASEAGEINAGSIATIDGADHRVLRVLRDGASMVRVVC